MLKSILPLLAVSLLVFCNNPAELGTESTSSSPGTFNLKLKINGFFNDYVKLVGFYGDINYKLDSVMVDAHGNAEFKRDSVLPGGMYFLVFPGDVFVQMLVDKYQQFSLEFDKNEVLGTIKVKNSLDNELLYQNLRFEAALQKKIEPINKQLEQLPEGSEERKKVEQEQDKLVAERKAHIQSFVKDHPDAFFTKFKIAGQNPDLKKPLKKDGTVDKDLQVYYYRNEFWNGVDFSDIRLLRTPVYFNKLKKYIKEMTPQVVDSVNKYADIVIAKSKADKDIFKFTVNWIALQYKNSKTMGQEAIYVHLVEKYWTHDQAWWSDSTEIKGLRDEATLMKPSLIGQTGQDIRAKNEFGQYISLYDIKAPVIVLYLFSYECDNCKKETPKLVKVINEWKNRGVECFTLCLDDNEEEWKKYLRENKMNFHNVLDFHRESRYHRKYHIDITPEIYVLDKDRKIIASNIGSDQLPDIFRRAGLK